MAITYAEGKTTASAKTRVFVAGLIGVAAFVLMGLAVSWAMAPIVGWDVASLVFTVWIWTTIWPLSSKLTAQHAVREDPSRSVSDVIVLSASVASLGALVLLLVQASHNTGAARILQVALGVISVVLSWAVVHTLFALRYAELYYTDPVGGIDFGGTDKPNYSDFAYLAFTVGMTFQVSDTTFTDRKFRKAALRHALISYVFGTVIVATTINLIAGLTK